MEVTQWEVKFIQDLGMEKEVNKLGKEGWEIAGVMGNNMWLKRPCGTVEITPKNERNKSTSYNPYGR